MAREFARPFYKSKEWKAVRESVLIRDHYSCVLCGQPATVVHHVIHISQKNIGDTSITLNQSNLISLCDDCHFQQHRGEHGRGRQRIEREELQNEYEFDENGYLILKETAPQPLI